MIEFPGTGRAKHRFYCTDFAACESPFAKASISDGRYRYAFPSLTCGITPARDWRMKHEKEIVAELSALEAIPNLASDRANIERNAAAIQELFNKRGVVTKLLTLEDAPPLIVAHLFEAMACEVPVIATRVGGIPELVEDKGCGYLFEIGDVDGMAAASLQVLSEDAERERLGRRGREIAVSRFRTEKIIPQYEELYSRVVRESPA